MALAREEGKAGVFIALGRVEAVAQQLHGLQELRHGAEAVATCGAPATNGGWRFARRRVRAGRVSLA
jgi:hypothetical protein